MKGIGAIIRFALADVLIDYDVKMAR